MQEISAVEAELPLTTMLLGSFFLLSFFSKFCVWHHQLSDGKLRSLNVLVRAHWARLARQTSQKALGYGEDWLEHQALPECEMSRQQSDEVAGSWCFLPAPPPSFTRLLLLPTILPCTSETSAPVSPASDSCCPLLGEKGHSEEISLHADQVQSVAGV